MSDDRSKISEIILFSRYQWPENRGKFDGLLLYEVAILSNVMFFFFSKITKYSDYLQNISGKL